MRANLPWRGLRILPVALLAAASAAWGDANADRQQEVEMAFDHFIAAKSPDQRASIADYLRQLGIKVVGPALTDHILAARDGVEATSYDKLVEALGQDGCSAVLDRLQTATDPISKGKLIVALRHCQSVDAVWALIGCLDDKRPFLFAAHGPHPRRVCDLAYDELFLKLRNDPHYGLDPSPKMTGVILERTPISERDASISKLRALIKAAESSTDTPEPSASPSPAPPAQSGTAAPAQP